VNGAFSASGSSFSIHEWRGSAHHPYAAAEPLIAALQADPYPAHQHEIYRPFDSELLE